MEGVINPGLYSRLRCLVEACFSGDPRILSDPVRVKKKGQEASLEAVYSRDIHSFYSKITHSGESYDIPCPECHRGRRKQGEYSLSVSYLYGQIDDQTGRPMYGLIHCYNEGCERREDFRERFRDAVIRGLETEWCGPIARASMELKEGVKPGPKKDMDRMPPGTVTLDDLDEFHLARQYLTDRGFDPDALARDFRIGVIPNINESNTRFAGRIIFPVIHEGKMRAFQTRLYNQMAERLGMLRYWAPEGSNIKHWLYNHDRVATKRDVVLVEGAPSCWAHPDLCVASFGDTLSPEQCDLLIGWSYKKRGSTLFIAYDPPKRDGDYDHTDRFMGSHEARRLVEAFSPRRVRLVRIPRGHDPADPEVRPMMASLLEAATPVQVD